MAAPMRQLGINVLSRYCVRNYAAAIQTKRKIRVGDELPDIPVYENTPSNEFSIRDLFHKKRGILFSIPGAFSPGCTQAHLPEYLTNYKRFMEEGYEVLACVAVNDPFVMDAWGKDISADGKIRMISDMRCEFTSSVGMDLDCTTLLGNVRSKRYFMLIEDNVVKHMSREPDDTGLACLLCIQRMKKD